MTERVPVVKPRSRANSHALVAAALAAVAILGGVVAAGGVRLARAADEPLIKVKVAGKLAVPAGQPLGLIATDPVLQQVLSQDLQVAGRLAGASASSVTTVTVTLTQRALAPGMSLNDVAPGDHDAVGLLKAIGVRRIPMPDAAAAQADQGEGQTAAEGNRSVPNDIRSYEQQSQEMEPAPANPPMAAPYNPWSMMNYPVPPATAQQRSALPYNMASPPKYHRGEDSSDEARNSPYDTIYIARATAGQSGSTLTVVAVAHPGYDRRHLRELVAEEIANAVLH